MKRGGNAGQPEGPTDSLCFFLSAQQRAPSLLPLRVSSRCRLLYSATWPACFSLFASLSVPLLPLSEATRTTKMRKNEKTRGKMTEEMGSRSMSTSVSDGMWKRREADVDQINKPYILVFLLCPRLRRREERRGEDREEGKEGEGGEGEGATSARRVAGDQDEGGGGGRGRERGRGRESEGGGREGGGGRKGEGEKGRLGSELCECARCVRCRLVPSLARHRARAMPTTSCLSCRRRTLRSSATTSSRERR